ncbi:MAG: hypothetical protein EOM26_05685 [Alphaproteobacteria bacterium]|nr:hypothetical protein [Alphaproteobacteria bacterium]
MANLEKLDSDEVELLVSLPYRIGCLISDADDEDGGHDDEQEEKALEEMLTALATGEKGTPFTREVAAGTLRHKDRWPTWRLEIFDVAEDCGRAIQIIQAKLGKNKAKNFRMAMLVVARSVAKAADEFDDFNPEDEEKSGFGALVEKVVKTVKPEVGREESHQTNVSPAEQAEIDRVANALHVED